ncbi:hypothetical protein [Micromonospora tulbaghiae]|uniref:hypothetical protein n=1 Tax=Micromonospora tulbaghiae TaxID=479978 RepID=UPI0033D8F4A0
MLNFIRNVVGILAYFGFIALIVTASIASWTGDGMTEAEQEAITSVFLPPIVVFIVLSIVLSPDDPKKRRRR